MTNLPPYDPGPGRLGPYPFEMAPLPALIKRGTRYYLDTEFIDDGHTIDLISIGIVCEDGREYYRQSRSYDPYKITEWLANNVIAHLKPCSHGISHVVKCMDVYQQKTINPDCPWRTNAEIRDEIEAFLDPSKYGKPELYTWCGTYDHIAFCQLWGKMMDLPQGFPHHVYDLQCELSDRGIEDHELPPQEQGLHNALDDARHIKRLWGIYGPHLPPYVS